MQANDLLYGDASDRLLSALLGARSLLGAALFAFGMAANVQADHILANLRKPGETSGYKIPRGGLFEYVSGAHFVAEVFEWTGYGIACGRSRPPPSPPSTDGDRHARRDARVEFGEIRRGVPEGEKR